MANKQRLKAALIGAETLLGRELEEVLKREIPELIFMTFAANAEGTFGKHEGEAVYVQALEPKQIEDFAVVLLAGTAEGAQKAYELVKAAKRKPLIIDCTGALESSAEARIIAPLLNEEPGHEWLIVLPHPAATAIALMLTRLARRSGLKQTIVHVFEPASERGKKGVSELHQQTTNLLVFKPLEKQVFDAQLSFNLLSRYGEDAPEKLAGIEGKIERHTATLIGRQSDNFIPMPSLRLIQAPVFHGYSMSLWVEFASEVTGDAVEQALASAQIEVRSTGDEPPDSVGVASQSGIIAGDIRIDRNNARAVWIWAVADNLRVTADAAANFIKARVRLNA